MPHQVLYDAATVLNKKANPTVLHGRLPMTCPLWDWPITHHIHINILTKLTTFTKDIHTNPNATLLFVYLCIFYLFANFLPVLDSTSTGSGRERCNKSPLTPY